MATKPERFYSDFVMGGTAAIISKSAAAPINRVKHLLQNQGELLKTGHSQNHISGSVIASKGSSKKKDFNQFGRVIKLMSFNISQLRLSILHSKVTSKVYLDDQRREIDI